MTKLKVNSRIIPTLVALTEGEQRQGLMHQTWPPPIMSFYYSEPKIRKFWMKNTPSPLDIVFVRQGKVISVENGVPWSEVQVGPDQMSDLVVEFPAGMAKYLKIDLGSEIILCPSLDFLSRKFSLDKSRQIDLLSKLAEEYERATHR